MILGVFLGFMVGCMVQRLSTVLLWPWVPAALLYLGSAWFDDVPMTMEAVASIAAAAMAAGAVGFQLQTGDSTS